jgi:GH25 family lysozyme M1 (1,4-beta-N-acetylmuramidase)/glucan-binding YG repeat protein
VSKRSCFIKNFLERGSITLVVHKRKLSFLATILFGLALCTFPVNAQEVSSSEQPFENQVSSVQSSSVSSANVTSSAVESSASSLSSSSESTSGQNTVSSAPSNEGGNTSSNLGGTTSSTASLQSVAPPVSDGWVTETGAIYYYKNGEKQKGWLQLDGKQYYLDSQTGARKTSELFQTEKGFSYAQADGTILSGGKKKGDNGNLYLASSDGILRAPGLLVTPDYDGYWAPYYIDAQTHAVKTGLFSVNGTYYYGREDKGYLACGKYKAPDGKTYLANSNGTLRDSGLIVTNQYDGYWAPYYIDAQTHAVKTGLFSVNGTYYYGREDKGYLACGKYKAPDGNTYLANSDGTLRKSGFLVTPDYDGYWAPYYIDPNTHAVKTGLFNINGTYYYGREDKGYLVCGKYKAPDGKTYLANNNGTLRAPGLLVTPDYDGYWAPYYIDTQTHAVKTGLFNINGTYYYGREDKGYLVCGKYKAPDGKFYLAQSDGTLKASGWVSTSDYDGSVQKYYVDANTHAVKTGIFMADGKNYYGREDYGYIVRGTYTNPNGDVYTSGDDGVLNDKMLGVDVSRHQGVIDWNKVKNTGISFAIIQAGYGDSSTQIDPYFIQNIEGALAAGIKVGSYWFSYATSVEDAKLEASVFANTLAPYKDRLTFPAFYDFEYASYSYYQKINKVEPTKENITDMAVAFIEAMKSMGYIAGNYTNLDYYRNYFDYSKLEQYQMWYAQYQVASPDVKTSLWQYSSKGTIDGIAGDADLDRYNIAGLPESTKTGICTATK